MRKIHDPEGSGRILEALGGNYSSERDRDPVARAGPRFRIPGIRSALAVEDCEGEHHFCADGEQQVFPPRRGRSREKLH